jgi:hypothetical protein
MVHHHFLSSHPRNPPRSPIDKLVNRSIQVKARHRQRGVIAGLGAFYIFVFSHNDKHDDKKTSDPPMSLVPDDLPPFITPKLRKVPPVSAGPWFDSCE